MPIEVEQRWKLTADEYNSAEVCLSAQGLRKARSGCIRDVYYESIVGASRFADHQRLLRARFYWTDAQNSQIERIDVTYKGPRLDHGTQSRTEDSFPLENLVHFHNEEQRARERGICREFTMLRKRTSFAGTYQVGSVPWTIQTEGDEMLSAHMYQYTSSYEAGTYRITSRGKKKLDVTKMKRRFSIEITIQDPTDMREAQAVIDLLAVQLGLNERQIDNESYRKAILSGSD